MVSIFSEKFILIAEVWGIPLAHLCAQAYRQRPEHIPSIPCCCNVGSSHPFVQDLPEYRTFNINGGTDAVKWDTLKVNIGMTEMNKL